MRSLTKGVPEIVRSADYDRYLSALFARGEHLPHLLALYAFNHEIAKTAETVSQPVPGLIRLQWWRETVDEIHTGRVRQHDVAKGLACAVERYALPRAAIDAMIDARESDLEEAPFADAAQQEAYADATVGNVMRLAARILGPNGRELDPRDDAMAREAGIAFALTGLLRALPYRAGRRNLVLPLDSLRAVGLSPEDVFAGNAGAQLLPVIAGMAERAMSHYRAARAIRVPRRLLPAFLPAILVPMYAREVTRPGFDPFRDATDIADLRRQFAMLRAAVRGRI
jgi:phytoene/squalene synthetase